MPAEAERLFGAPPTKSRPTTNARYEFPDEWLDNEDVVRAARRTAREFNKRDKEVPASPEERELARRAEAFIKAYYKRRRDLPAAAGNR
jgi:hypothetical protein